MVCLHCPTPIPVPVQGPIDMELGVIVFFKKSVQWTYANSYSIRVFPKVDHSGRSARIVLDQINSAKKMTSNRSWTLDPRTVYAAHFLSLMAYPCARSHCLKDWDLNDPYLAMLYWFQLNPLSSSKSTKQ